MDGMEMLAVEYDRIGEIERGRKMIELSIWRRLIGMDEMGHILVVVRFTDFLWRVVVYPCNKDQEKRLMKV